MISHLGANPVRGGSPAKDNNRRGVREVSKGALAQEQARELMFVASLNLKAMKVDRVMVI